MLTPPSETCMHCGPLNCKVCAVHANGWLVFIMPLFRLPFHDVFTECRWRLELATNYVKSTAFSRLRLVLHLRLLLL